MSFGGVFRKTDGGALGAPDEVKVLLRQAFPGVVEPIELSSTGPGIDLLKALLKIDTLKGSWVWFFEVLPDDYGVHIDFDDTDPVYSVPMQIHGMGTDAGFKLIEDAIATLERVAGWTLELN
jgi:hypothetical protein